MKSATEIIDECLRTCKTYREIDRELLRGIEYEYSVSEEVQEALEEADPTGKQLEKFCTNLEEVEEHDAIWSENMHQHVLSCDKPGCAELRAFRKEKELPGY